MSTEADSGVKKRKDSTPPDGYVCRLCSVPGHWIQVRFISENCELMFFVDTDISSLLEIYRYAQLRRPVVKRESLLIMSL